MINQKDISTWNEEDILNWLKSINMNQYIPKFESNKINGYDLIYLTKEDLKSLGIVNIHDKNIILNSMKDALLQQLKLNVNFKDKSVTIQLDFDPNYTVEQLINTLKLIFKPISSIFLVTNNNEILMPNLKIIDLILYNPKIYKNFKILLDSQIISNNNNYFNKDNLNKDYLNKENIIKNNLNKDNLNKDYLNKDYLNKDNLNKDYLNKDNLNNDYLDKDNLNSNENNNISQKKIISNKNPYEKYYKLNIDNDYNMDNNNTASFNINNDNNNNFNKKEKYSNNFITLDNNDFNKKNLEKKDNKYKYISNTNSNININNNDIKYNDEKLFNRYKTYEDYNKKNDLNNNDNNYFKDFQNKDKINYDKLEIKKNINNQNNQNNYRTMRDNSNKEYISNNNIYEYNRNITPIQNETKRLKASSTYRKKYTIENGELNFEFEDYKDKKRINNNNLYYDNMGKEDDDNQKYSSEKRNFRTSEFNVRDNYDNNNNNNNNINIHNIFLSKKSYNYKTNGMNDKNNYDISSIIGNKDKNEKLNNTTGFNEHRKYNNSNHLSLNYNKNDEQK